MLKWEDLPVEMKSSEVESYYQLVSKRKGSLIFKRCLDWVLALGGTYHKMYSLQVGAMA